MQNSLKNKLFIGLTCLLCTNCATSKFEANVQGGRTELYVSPDRVVMECEPLYKEGKVTFYGFSIYVLDRDNTAIPIIQGNRIGKRNCEDRFLKIGNMLKNGRTITIGGMGDLPEPKTLAEDTITFPKLGSFKMNDQVLQFEYIKNDLGQCYDAYYAEEKCPAGPFPLEKK